MFTHLEWQAKVAALDSQTSSVDASVVQKHPDWQLSTASYMHASGDVDHPQHSTAFGEFSIPGLPFLAICGIACGSVCHHLTFLFERLSTFLSLYIQQSSFHNSISS